MPVLYYTILVSTPCWNFQNFRIFADFLFFSSSGLFDSLFQQPDKDERIYYFNMLYAFLQPLLLFWANNALISLFNYMLFARFFQSWTDRVSALCPGFILFFESHKFICSLSSLNAFEKLLPSCFLGCLNPAFTTVKNLITLSRSDPKGCG